MSSIATFYPLRAVSSPGRRVAATPRIFQELLAHARVSTAQPERKGETNIQKRELKIVNRLGLHARAAAKLVTLCMRYQSVVTLHANGRVADGRRLIALLTLSASLGVPLAVEASGADEAQAIMAVTRLISDGFGEG
jgi:phosphocarrier protein HPr